mmetsp:Transcript_37536/g.44776  ORF Transcript_37536/g.44776 Transcript_37536/m.44776 type:complete len:202 (-) Transcript_37536:218-823(-)
MEYHPKRTFQLEEFDKLADPSGLPTKKRKSVEGDEEEADMSSVHDDGDQSSTKEKKQSAEMRLEVNRQRAREIRKRKKIMIENMQNQLVLLTMENNKLRMENQNQQQELAVLRKTSQLLTSNHGARAPPPPPAPTTLTTADILNLINAQNNNPNDQLSELLLGARHAGNVRNNEPFLQSNALPPSLAGLGHQTLQNHNYRF